MASGQPVPCRPEARLGLWRCLALLAVCCAAGVAVPLGLGLHYSDRLSYQPGYYLVAGSERQPMPIHRPRRAVLVVFDGLGHEEAASMGSLAPLRAVGQCRLTDVAPLSLSRPVFAVLSTGLEQDRTGVRGNDDEEPLAAESVWDIAQQAGLSVAAVSELSWWRQLAPGGFSSYQMPPREADYFGLLPGAAVGLVHPIYVDEIGHEHGAASQQYRAAVQRADRELAGFLGTLDLARDLVIVTADHGHALHGGHGGRQERIAHVLTCYAGPGVLHREGAGGLRATSIAPSLALLLGLRFPAQMRAGEDDLAALWEIADPAAFPPGYLDQRRQAVERLRAANRAQLLRWAPASGGTWPGFYCWHRLLQAGKAVPFAGLLWGLLWAHGRLGAGLGRRRWRGWAVLGLFCLAVGGVHVALRGSFDMSAIANRGEFLRFTLALGGISAAGFVGLHLWRCGSLRLLMLDLGALVLGGALLSLGHPVVFGWHLGFPLPPPAWFYFPYFAALFVPSLSGAGLLLCAGAAWRRRASCSAR